MLPLLVLEPDSNPRHAFVEDILKTEGLFFFQRASLRALPSDAAQQAAMIVALNGPYSTQAAELLDRYVKAGGRLVTFTACPTLLGRFGLTAGPTVEHAWVVMGQDGGFDAMGREDLLCPGHTAWRLAGAGAELLKLRSNLNEHLGSAIRESKAGRGRVIAFGYDPVSTVIALRHGLGDFDAKPETRHLQGPRHIHAIIGMAALYSQRVPICDVHMDLVREALLRYFPAGSPVPRFWHFPRAASSVYFIKSDGCGEKGLDREIELAESFSAPVTFYRNLPSAYSKKQLRDYHERGHGIGIELNLNPITYGKSLAELRNADDRLRARIREFTDDFDKAFGLPAASVCIHSCQWTGGRMVRLLQEHGWSLADHFCGHDPRKNRHDYGLYAISSTLPMRYYDPEAGVMDFYLQPAQGDESQSVGWVAPEEKSARRLGFSLPEYTAVLQRAILENNRDYHGVHIGNWHPLYLSPGIRRTPLARFYNRDAFIAIMRFLGEQDILRWQLEAWTRFTLARRAVEIRAMRRRPGRTDMELHSPRDVAGLTLLLHRFDERGEALLNGRPLPVRSKRLERRRQYFVTLDLSAGQTATLTLTSPAKRNERQHGKELS
ncbi:MAG: hypothetical protein HY343_12215 [Lentisphaerae bacterium]|nr:hypothetical protein [Lentisphaerota bacterium]